MYYSYQDREELEDELYREEDSDGSEVNSELEFHLYSQLHYSSNTGEREEQEDGAKRENEGKGKDQLEAKAKPGDGKWKDSEHSRPLSHNRKGLQKHLKGRTELEQKTKKLNEKKKVTLKVFQEVIVIDSGPDVISISEDDTDDGVCVIKGQKSRPLQSSTPAQQATQKKRSPDLGSVVNCDSSESEESGSKSESESDSDGLENWMILGQDQQDGDQSISLNLEGKSDSNTDVDEDDEGRWLVSSKDMEAKIYNKDKGARVAVHRMSYRYYTDKNVTCRNCNKTGHLSKNCPTPKVLSCFLCGTRGHLVIDCPNKHCNNCGLPGHLYESCCEKAYWNKQCHRCGMTGHFLDTCPEIWRQYHMTTKAGPPEKRKEDLGRTPPYCYNCSKKGHFGHACGQRRMFNGTYPSTPFINSYDTVTDIRHREHKIQLKVAHLKESGLFPTSSQTPLTPGPPKKRQKTNHYSNHHQPNHTSHHTPNHHKNNHIRFGEGKPWSATKPKTKADKRQQPRTSSSSKQWKPKRDVPTTRAPLPPAKPADDEESDFPRGGGQKRRKYNKKKSPFKPQASTPDHLFGASHQAKKKAGNKAAKKSSAAEMYPTDENLFAIKQRKRKR
ncbi:zinc finger CCHC domain-containing protein 7 [Diretmus argenteus]